MQNLYNFEKVKDADLGVYLCSALSSACCQLVRDLAEELSWRVLEALLALMTDKDKRSVISVSLSHKYWLFGARWILKSHISDFPPLIKLLHLMNEPFTKLDFQRHFVLALGVVLFYSTRT